MEAASIAPSANSSLKSERFVCLDKPTLPFGVFGTGSFKELGEPRPDGLREQGDLVDVGHVFGLLGIGAPRTAGKDFLQGTHDGMRHPHQARCRRADDGDVDGHRLVGEQIEVSQCRCTKPRVGGREACVIEFPGPGRR